MEENCGVCVGGRGVYRYRIPLFFSENMGLRASKSSDNLEKIVYNRQILLYTKTTRGGGLYRGVEPLLFFPT